MVNIYPKLVRVVRVLYKITYQQLKNINLLKTRTTTIYSSMITMYIVIGCKH